MHNSRSLVEQPIWPVLAAASIQLGDQANDILADEQPLTQGDRLKKLAKEFDVATSQWVQTAFPPASGDILFNDSLLLTEPFALNSLNRVVRGALIDRADAGVLIDYAKEHKEILERVEFRGFRSDLSFLLFSKGIALLDRGRFSFRRIFPDNRTLAVGAALGLASTSLLVFTRSGTEFLGSYPIMGRVTFFGPYYLPALVRAIRELAGSSRLRRRGVGAMEYAVEMAKGEWELESAFYGRLISDQRGACHRRILQKLIWSR